MGTHDISVTPPTQATADRFGLALSRSLPVWLLALLIGGVALLPRVVGLADFFTYDEGYHWVERVNRFALAVATGNWAATDITGHPGVTTMWLGALGHWLAIHAGAQIPDAANGGTKYLAALRLPLAVANSLAVMIGYLVLRRLMRPTTALLAGLLWASSPFLIANSRLLHLDALVTSLMTLSLLLALYATTDDQQFSRGEPVCSLGPRSSFVLRHLSLVLSGIFAGLALLTKAPSLLLLPLIGLLLLFLTNDQRPTTNGQHIFRLSSFVFRRLSLVTRLYLIWLSCAVVMVFLLWPALWVAPREALTHVFNEITLNGGEPHPRGNYFLGQPVADPGPLFYPAVMLWRTTPWTLVGLLALPLAFRQAAVTTGRERRAVLALLAYALLFGVLMSLEPKKFDRYLLPIWPALEVMAAVGLVGVLDWVRRPRTNDQRTMTNDRRLMTDDAIRNGANTWVRPYSLRHPVIWSGVVLLLALNLASYHPYYLAYFNPLLGGGATAQRVMLVGWGEGMEQVGQWLRNRPDLARGVVLSWDSAVLTPFVPVEVDDVSVKNLKRPAGYAVLYVRGMQRREAADATNIIRQNPPLFTLRLHGIEYVTVYQLPRPFDQPINAVFGDGLHLRGFSQQRTGNTLVITPSWDVQADQSGGVFCFVHVLAPDGTRVAQIDAPIDDGMFATWQRGQQFGSQLPMTLPDLPVGSYRVVLGVYDQRSGARLPVSRPALPDPLDGPNVIELTTLNIHP